MKISIVIPMGIENLLFPAQKMSLGISLECNFFIPFQTEIKIIGQFPGGVEIQLNSCNSNYMSFELTEFLFFVLI